MSLIQEIFLIFGGITLAIGILNLNLGLSRYGERSYLWFGIFSVFASFFSFLQHPALLNSGSASLAGIATILFAAIYLIAFIWYIGEYTNYRLPVLQSLLSVFIIAALVLYLYDSQSMLWDAFANLTILGIAIYGILAGIKGHFPVSKPWKRLFVIFMVILLFLTANAGLDNIFKFGDAVLWRHLNIPVDLFPVLFAVVMGSKMTNDIIRKQSLERQLAEREQRWTGLMDNVALIVVELDSMGNVLFVNDYFVQVTGFRTDEIMGNNWFQAVVPADQQGSVQTAFQEIISSKKSSEHINSIRTKAGDSIILQWKNLFFYDQENESSNVVSIGLDITVRERAFKEIQDLKNQLEKENLLLKEEIEKQTAGSEIIGNSSAIQYTIQRSLQVADTDSSVLLEGETGSGKELFANLIHRKSKRSSRPMIKVNCATLPNELIESELFGHEKGSFTGAYKTRRGRFEMAHNGTIFLDEIGELPLELQPKLLRVLQSGEFESIGSDVTKKVNVRVIAATNRNLEIEVKNGRFREDLFYRLNVYPITVPPLRHRKEDIPLLVRHFVRVIGSRIDKKIQHIRKSDLQKLENYDWPGNVRELENIVERGLINSANDILSVDIPIPSALDPDDSEEFQKSSSLEQNQKDVIIQALESCGWKINGANGAAAKLDVHPSTLRSKMKKLNIRRPDD